MAFLVSLGAAHSETLYISYSNGDNYVEEYSSSGPGGVNTDLGPLPGTTTRTGVPNGIALDSAGNLYVANDSNNTISKFDPNGNYLGVFASGFSQPAAIAFDGFGNLYVVNGGIGSVSKVSPAGVVTTFVSSGLNSPQGIAIGPDGNIYVSEQGNNTVAKITPAGVVSSFYSDGSWTVVNQLEGLAFDSAGNLYIASYRTNTIEKVTPAGVASVFASNASSNPQGINNPIGLAFDGSGDLFVANFHYASVSGAPYNGANVSYIDEFSPSGTLITAFANNMSLPGADANLRDANYIAITGVSAKVAENLNVSASSFASSGTAGGPFVPVSKAYGVANVSAASQTSWTAGVNQNWVTLSATGGTLAGSGSTTVTATINSNANALASGTYSATVTFGDPSTGYVQTAPMTLTVAAMPVITSALSASGTVGIAFSYQIGASNNPVTFGAIGLPAGLSVSSVTGLISGTATATGTSNVVISAAGSSSSVSGTLVLAIVAPPPPGITSALIANTAVGQAFNYQITATNNPVSFGASGLPSGLSINSSSGLISGTAASAGSSNVLLSAIGAGGTGTATLTLSVAPQTSSGSQTETLYISYSNGDNYVEEFSSTGPGGVNTDLGPLPNTTTRTADPNGIALDSAGNLYVANDANNTITKFDPNGNYLGVFASGLNQPAAIAFDGAGTLYVVNGAASSVLKISPAGVVTPFISSGLSSPQGIAIGPDGNIYVSNQGDNSVKKITPAGVMTTFYQDGSWTVVNQLEGLAFDTAGNLYIASYRTNSIEKVTPAGVASVFASNPSPASDPNDPDNPSDPEGIYNPIGLTFDSSGDLFVGNYHHTQVPGQPYEGHGISYIDEYSMSGAIINEFTGNPALPGADPNLRDVNYIAIRAGTLGPVEGLEVSATSAFTPNGPVGGPFSPGSNGYTVINSGTAPLGWSASANQSWITLSSTSGTLAGSGSASVTASINANANAMGAGSYSASITFADTGTGYTQTETVTLTVIPLPVITSPLVATGTSGSVFTYQIVATNGPATYGVSGLPAGLTLNTTTGLISGTAAATGTSAVLIRAANGGGAGFATLVLTIQPPPPVITSPLTATGTSGVRFTYQISATNSPSSFGASGLPSGLTLNSATGLISGTATSTGASTVTISAVDVSGSGSATLILTIQPAPPVITSPLTATAIAGAGFSYQISASNGPASYGASGLPAGLSVNAATGLISGTATVAGTSTVTISAANISGTGSASLTLTVQPPAPVITSSLAATGTSGSAFAYQITASNGPGSYVASGLPAGLSVNTTTGLISGTVAVAGTSTVTINAANISGTGTATLVLAIQPPAPVITSAPTATGTAGAAFSYQISASNNPSSYGANGLPAGLSLNSVTGLISGTGTTTGTSTVSISAANVSGTGSGILILTIQPPPPVITSPLTATATSGTSFTYQITASNGPSSFGASGLPTGLSINAATGLISGTASTTGTSTVNISAANVSGTGSAMLVLAVLNAPPPPPVITSAPSATGTAGVAFTYQISATNSPASFGASGLPAGLSVNTANGLITGTTSVTGTSNVTISAANVSGTGSATLLLTILPQAPAINSPLAAVAVSGSAFSYQITATNGPTSYSASGLPAGLSVNAATGVISGTAAAIGTSSVSVAASNAGGSGSATLILSVQPPPPVVTSVLTASGTVGISFSYLIMATNNPTSFSASGLPAGLGINSATGVISGSPQSSGTTSVTIGAANITGSGNAILTVTVAVPPPSITSALTATAFTGSAFIYQITASNSPASFNASGLPAGLSINPASGLISGTTSSSGVSNVTISAANASGTGSATLVLTSQAPGSQSEQLFISYANSENYVEEYTSSGTSGVNTDTGPLPGTATHTGIPNGVAFDSAGNLYVANDSNNTITKFDPKGNYLGVFATGLNQPAAIAFDRVGNLYVVNGGGGSVAKVTPGGVSSILASGLSSPQGIAAGPDGNIYVSEQGNNTVARITPAGVVSSFYSDGSWTVVNQLEGLAFDGAGNLYIASYRTSSIEEVTPSGAATVFAGNANSSNPQGIYNPIGLAFDGNGDLFVANFHSAQVSSAPYNGANVSYIDEFSANGTLINAFANNPSLPGADTDLHDANYIAIRTSNSSAPVEGLQVSSTSSFASIGPASGPFSPVSDSYGLANSGTASISWSAAASQSWLTLSATGGTLAGSGSTNLVATVNAGANTLASGTYTATISITDLGTAYSQTEPVTLVVIPPPAITSSLSAATTVGQAFIYQITATNSPVSFGASGLPSGLSINPSSGLISGTTTASGTSSVLLSAVGAGGTGTATLILNVAAQSTGGGGGSTSETVYISYGNGDNYVEEYSSTGPGGLNTDLGPLPNTTILNGDPNGIALDSGGNLYVANDATNAITKFDPNGNYLGIFASGFDQPAAITFDSAGTLYVVNNANSSISRVSPAGVVSTFISSGLSSPQGIAIGPDGNIYVTDQGSNSVKKITPGGTITHFYQDGSYLIANQLEGLAFDSAGNLYLASYRTNIIVKITPGGVGTIFASNSGDPSNPSDPEGIYNPIGLAFDSNGDLFVGNFHHTQVPGQPYEGHGISYIDEYSPAGVLLSEFTGNLSLPGADPNLRDANYIAIRAGTSTTSSRQLSAMVLSSRQSLESSGVTPSTETAATEWAVTTPSANTAAVPIGTLIASDTTSACTFFLATLDPAESGSGTAIALEARSAGVTHILAQTGEGISVNGTSEKVSSITTLVSSPGTSAAARWLVGPDGIGAQLKFGDGSEAIYEIPATATSPLDWSLVAISGPATGIASLDGISVAGFSLPGFSASNVSYAARLLDSQGPVSGINDAVLISGSNVIAQKGSPAPGASGALFTSFSAPLCGPDGSVAFEAVISRSGGDASGIWYAGNGINPQLLAITGGSAPGGGHYRKFLSMVLPATGPVFIATLQISAVDHVTGANNLGLWAEGPAGLELLLRSGQVLAVSRQTRTIDTLTLQAAPGGCNVLATFTDGTTETLNLSSL